MCLLMSPTSYIHYGTKNKFRKLEAKAEMCRKRLLVKSERQIGIVENSSYNPRVLGEHALKILLEKKPMKHERQQLSARHQKYNFGAA